MRKEVKFVDKLNYGNVYMYTTNYMMQPLTNSHFKKKEVERKVEKNTPTFDSFLQKSMDNKKK